MSVQPPSAKSKKLRDLEVYVAVQMVEHPRMVAEATRQIKEAEMAALKVQAERDLARGVGAGSSLLPPGPSLPGPSSFSFPSPHHPSPSLPPPLSFLSSLGPKMRLEAMEWKLRWIKDQEEERRRGTQLTQPGNMCVNQELLTGGSYTR